MASYDRLQLSSWRMPRSVRLCRGFIRTFLIADIFVRIVPLMPSAFRDRGRGGEKLPHWTGYYEHHTLKSSAKASAKKALDQIYFAYLT